MSILLVAIWVLAAGSLLFLVIEMASNRILATRRGPVRKVTAAPADDNLFTELQARPETRGLIKPLGYIALLLWEIYWLSEVASHVSDSSNPWQLPYFMLLIVLIVIPFLTYLVARTILRNSAPR